MRRFELVSQIAETMAMSDDQAAAILDAFLETLGERVDPAVAKKLSAKLPAETVAAFSRYAAGQPKFSAEAFVDCFAERANLDLDTARHAIKTTWDLLKRTMPSGSMERVKGSLPADYRKILDMTAYLPPNSAK